MNFDSSTQWSLRVFSISLSTYTLQPLNTWKKHLFALIYMKANASTLPTFFLVLRAGKCCLNWFSCLIFENQLTELLWSMHFGATSLLLHYLLHGGSNALPTCIHLLTFFIKIFDRQCNYLQFSSSVIV